MIPPRSHNRLRFLFLLLLMVVAGGSERAALAARSPVKWTAAITPAVARPGETVRVTVTATIQEPYHIYSIVPVTPPPGPQETVLTVTGASLVPVGAVTESAVEKKNDPNFGKEVGLHGKTATFTRHLQVPPDASAAAIPLAVTVRFMACTDAFCLPPKNVTIETPALAVEAGAARAEYTNLAVGAATTTPEDSSGNTMMEPAAIAGETAADSSLLTFVLGAFGAGLLALVTPCVFPMIPVTLAYFTKQATNKSGVAARGSIVTLAATYSLGIVVAFTLIGAVLAATVGAAGANRLAASPWVNLVFAVLFIVFGLALLEIVELRPPMALQRLTSGAGRNSDKTGGVLGVLVMGLTFVIAAFTCTAPFIGTVLVAASQAATGAQWLRPIVGMMAFSTALALPFFLLALFPGWLARLPKSGAWLTTVKGTMGFIEIAAALKFLSNTDLVWQWKLLTQPVLLALWTIIAFAAAAWLLGSLKIGFGAPEGRPSRARYAWSGLFVAIAVYCLWGMTGRPMNSWLVAFLPPAEYGYGHRAGAASDEPTFLATLEEGLAQAKAENKPIFVDFTGYTCTNCRWMEKNVFPVASVRGEMEQFVRVRLYTDDTKVGQTFQDYQEKTFGTLQLPLYAVLTPDGTPVAKPVGMVRDPAAFADFLRQARQQQTVAKK